MPMVSPKSLKNLKPPFTSANRPRGGRPKGTVSLATRFRNAVYAVDPKDRKAIADKMVDVVIDLAIRKKDLKAIELAARFIGEFPDVKDRLANALGVQVNVNSSGAALTTVDLDLSGDRIVAINRIIRECNLIDVDPVSVVVKDPGIAHGSNGNGVSGSGAVLPPPPDSVHPAG
jgi:hypothetical protein